jgi:hypothetical protein
VTSWADQAADVIEQGVSTVRDRAVEPVRSAARAVVFGVLASSFLTMAALLAAIGFFRGLVELADGIGLGVWAAHLVLGILFVGVGWFLFARRHPRPRTA